VGSQTERPRKESLMPKQPNTSFISPAQKVLDFLRSTPKPADPCDIAEATFLPYYPVRDLIAHLSAAGYVTIARTLGKTHFYVASNGGR
jgi:hypothetical protein